MENSIFCSVLVVLRENKSHVKFSWKWQNVLWHNSYGQNYLLKWDWIEQIYRGVFRTFLSIYDGTFGENS